MFTTLILSNNTTYQIFWNVWRFLRFVASNVHILNRDSNENKLTYVSLNGLKINPEDSFVFELVSEDDRYKDQILDFIVIKKQEYKYKINKNEPVEL